MSALATTDPHSPIVGGELRVTKSWIEHDFRLALARARMQWGPNASAITDEILAELVPTMRIREPETGAECELRRRVRLAVAAILNAAGIPTPYPEAAKTPRTPTMPDGPPWHRALLTGWLR